MTFGVDENPLCDAGAVVVFSFAQVNWLVLPVTILIPEDDTVLVPLHCVRYPLVPVPVTLSVFIASTSYGFMDGVDYEYHIIYSE